MRLIVVIVMTVSESDMAAIREATVRDLADAPDGFTARQIEVIKRTWLKAVRRVQEENAA